MLSESGAFGGQDPACRVGHAAVAPAYLVEARALALLDPELLHDVRAAARARPLGFARSAVPVLAQLVEDLQEAGEVSALLGRRGAAASAGQREREAHTRKCCAKVRRPAILEDKPWLPAVAMP